jgi:SAM-dependent methyltransferase
LTEVKTAAKARSQAEPHLAPPEAEGYCCPYCAAPLASRGLALVCTAEGRAFASTAGVFRLMEEGRRAELQPRIEIGHRLRRDEGFVAEPGLPEVPEGHPQASLWKRRAANLDEGLRRLEAVLGERPWRVLEVGAGCAWAGAFLARGGHRVTAVDASLDPDDGLLAAERLLPSGGPGLDRAEADMEALPLEAGRFDLVLAVDSLHHARGIQRALVEWRRVTRRGGALLVLESPVYGRREDGEADVARRMRHLRRHYAIEPGREALPGYLVRSELGSLFAQSGYRLEDPPTASGLASRALEIAAALLGRSGLPTRPVLLARRDG